MSGGWRTIGVLGGMGPAATVDFMAKLLAASGAERDQDHPRIVVDCDPTLPDRHAAVRGEGPSPGPRLAEMARGLLALGAEVLAMPCNTAHAFEADILAAIDGDAGVGTVATTRYVSIVPATLQETGLVAPRAKRVGLLEAQGCREAGLYRRALTARGLEAVMLDDEAQARLMALVWRIKAGDVGEAVRDEMLALAEDLAARGAAVVAAACTEVPLALSAGDLRVPFIDSTAALARATIEAARLPTSSWGGGRPQA